MKIAFIFPGQGAQFVGMGKDFADRYPSAKKIFMRADEVLGFPLSKLIFEGPQDELLLTKNSQPAILVVSMAILQVMKELYPHITPDSTAGLSLGEYTALIASGKCTFEDALLLVKNRAQLMNQATIDNPGSMRVVLGLSEEQMIQALSQLPENSGVWGANFNCPGQVVISGTIPGLDLAAEELKKAGAKRVLPLDVSGAFHSGLMQQAQDQLKPFIDKVALSLTDISLVMNAVGGYVSSTDELRLQLTRQVTAPVFWNRGIEAMKEKGIQCFIEIGPGKTLTGMNKKIGVVQAISIEKVEDLDQLQHLGEVSCVC